MFNFSFATKILIGILLLKFILVWVFIPSIVGFGVRKAEQCPEVDFDKLITESFDAKIDEIKTEENKFIHSYIEYSKWKGHLQFKVFKGIYQLTSGCKLS